MSKATPLYTQKFTGPRGPTGYRDTASIEISQTPAGSFTTAVKFNDHFNTGNFDQEGTAGLYALAMAGNIALAGLTPDPDGDLAKLAMHKLLDNFQYIVTPRNFQ